MRRPYIVAVLPLAFGIAGCTQADTPDDDGWPFSDDAVRPCADLVAYFADLDVASRAENSDPFGFGDRTIRQARRYARTMLVVCLENAGIHPPNRPQPGSERP